MFFDRDALNWAHVSIPVGQMKRVLPSSKYQKLPYVPCSTPFSPFLTVIIIKITQNYHFSMKKRIHLILYHFSCSFETGLCVLLSNSAQHKPQLLKESQFPVFTIYAQKVCISGKFVSTSILIPASYLYYNIQPFYHNM